MNHKENMKSMRNRPSVPIVVSLLCSSLAGQGAVILDNTANGTKGLISSVGSISTYAYNAKIITTPGTGSWALDAMKMALYSNTPASRTVFVDLMAVDGFNMPTGSVITSESFVVELTTTPAYYDFDLDQSQWSLTPGTSYALVFRSDATNTSTSWTQPPPGELYSMSEGFSYVANLRSTNGGTTWSTNTYYNGLELSVVSAVPEPGSNLALLVLGAGGLTLRRRLKRAA